MHMVRSIVLVLMLLLVGGSDRMPAYETPYYVIYTDLTPEQARIASIRMTKMAEEYARRMSDFGPKVRKKLPFYLFKDKEDYYATGAPRGSAGRFNGTALLAVAEDFGPKTWHLVQHEGFHQFADAIINANLPAWVNEGLAEYFGEAVFTGDGFVTGAIPQWRLDRIRKRFLRGEFKSLDDMMRLPISEWNTELSLANYDQAWSMVQFLAHGDGGRYQKSFSAFLGQLGRGQNQFTAWKNTFGETLGFEEKWRRYWRNLPDDPTLDTYRQATVATLTSFLGRALARQQTFADFDAFAKAAIADQLKCDPEDWLPRSLLGEALDDAAQSVVAGASYSIEIIPKERLPSVICTLPDGSKLIGRFTLRRGRIEQVSVEATGG
jgi:hypothetical protein